MSMNVLLIVEEWRMKIESLICGCGGGGGGGGGGGVGSNVCVFASSEGVHRC